MDTTRATVQGGIRFRAKHMCVWGDLVFRFSTCTVAQSGRGICGHMDTRYSISWVRGGWVKLGRGDEERGHVSLPGIRAPWRRSQHWR